MTGFRTGRRKLGEECGEFPDGGRQLRPGL